MEGPTKPMTVEIGVGERVIAEQEVQKRLRRNANVNKEAVQWVVQAVEQLGEVQGSAAPDVCKWVRANVQQLPSASGEGTVLLALKRAVRQGLLQRGPGGRFLLPSAEVSGGGPGLIVSEAQCGCPSKVRKKGGGSGGKRHKGAKRRGAARRRGKSRSRGRRGGGSKRRKSGKRGGGSKKCKPRGGGRSKRRKAGGRGGSKRRHGGSKKRGGRSKGRSRSSRRHGRHGGGRSRSRSSHKRRKSRCQACVKLWKNHLREGNLMLCQHCRDVRQRRNLRDRQRRRDKGRGGRGGKGKKGGRRGGSKGGSKSRKCPEFIDDFDDK